MVEVTFRKLPSFEREDYSYCIRRIWSYQSSRIRTASYLRLLHTRQLAPWNPAFGTLKSNRVAGWPWNHCKNLLCRSLRHFVSGTWRFPTEYYPKEILWKRAEKASFSFVYSCVHMQKKGQQFRSFATLAKRRGYTPEYETTGSAE